MKEHARRAPSDAFALLMEMGTGKTKVQIDEFGERAVANDVSDLMVIAPAGCYRNWFEDRGPTEPSEFRKHMDPELFDRTLITPWFSSDRASDRIRISNMLEERERPRAFVLNVEAFSTRSARALEAAREFIRTSRKGVIVAIDESTTIKGRRAERTKNLIDLAHMDGVAARRIMTGLVTPHSPLDVYSQFDFLDWKFLGFKSFFSFRARYSIMQRLPRHMVGHNRPVFITTGFRNIDELTEKIAKHSFRVLKEDCLDLPSKIYMPMRDVELTKEQARIYREVKDHATSALNDEEYVTVQMVLTQRMRLDQILCGFTMDEAGKLHEIPENRSSALLELLSDYEGKAIIWTTHDYCVRKIGDMLRKEYGPNSVAQFWGGNAKTRGQDESRFKNDPECRFMISTQSAGGRGNTWTVAGLSIYYNNSDNLEHRLQSEDRNHRDGLQLPGGAGKAIYHDLCAFGTLDTKKIANLRDKIDIATQIQQDPYKDWLV